MPPMIDRAIGELVRGMKMDLFPRPFRVQGCLLYTSDAADERSSVDLGGRRIIKKKNAACTEPS